MHRNGKTWHGAWLAASGVAALIFVLAAPAYAQLGKGVVSGTVFDPTGASVPNASVTLTNESTNTEKTAPSNSVGLYRLDFVDPGSYTLRVQAPGFAPSETKALQVTVGQTVTSDVHLKIGMATAQTVTVEASGVQLANTANAEISGLVNRTEIQNLPLEIRDPIAFVDLQPGAVPNVFNGSMRGAAVNGQRGGSGNFMIDGGDNNDYNQGGRSHNLAGGLAGGIVSISPDAVQEFRVVTNNFSAEYGRQGGFVTDMVLRSGTNRMHGSAFEYNRNSATTADDFFSARVHQHDQLVRNQFGGSLGGPIEKDKMFVFGTVEVQRLRQSTPISGETIRPEFINFVESGDFTRFVNQNPNLFGLTAPIDCSNPQNPGCGLGPIFKELQTKYPLPLPNSPASAADYFSSSPIYPGTIKYPVPVLGPFTYPGAVRFDEARGSVRYDYQISERNTLSAHYAVDDFPEFIGGNGGDFQNAYFGQQAPGRAQNGQLGYTHTFSPDILNEAKFTYLRATNAFPRQDADVPSIGTSDGTTVGFGASQSIPSRGVLNTFQWQDSISISHGRHSYKVGGEYRRTRNGSTFDSAVYGFYQFWDSENLLTDGAIGDLTTNPFTSSTSGAFAVAMGAINPASPVPALPDTYRGYRANEFSWYAQDNWRASSRLTVNLGLRYDYFGVPHNFRPDIDSNFYWGPSNLDQCITRNGTGQQVCLPGLGVTNPVSTNPFYPVNPATAAEFGAAFQVRNNELWNKDTNNFAPRVGLAYDVFGNQKTVVRLGGGVFYDRMWNNLFENIRFNPPYYAMSQFGLFVNGTVQGPISTPGFYSIPVNVANFAGPGATASPRHMDQNIVTPYTEQINFDIQQQLSPSWLLDVAYLGTFGHKLTGVVDLNTFDGRTVPGLSTRRINPNIGADNARGNFYDSNYHALQARVTHRFSRGFQMNANYTWSHALDYVSDAFFSKAGGDYHPEDNYNRSIEYGNADFDIRHRLVGDFNWDLPLFHGNRVLGGWSLNGILTWQSGSPFTIYDSSSDSNRDGHFNDRAMFLGSGNIASAVLHNQSPADGYLTPANFAATPAPDNGFANGLLARNAVFGPTYFNTDLSLQKEFRLKERASLKLLVSAFNIWNHPNFSMVPVFSSANVGNIANPEFGQAQSTVQPNNTGTGARVMQFAVRIDF
jgi:outer membrane receptor protein involved in Fe transport